jgi:hypothetical protein
VWSQSPVWPDFPAMPLCLNQTVGSIAACSTSSDTGTARRP